MYFLNLYLNVLCIWVFYYTVLYLCCVVVWTVFISFEFICVICQSISLLPGIITVDFLNCFEIFRVSSQVGGLQIQGWRKFSKIYVFEYQPTISKKILFIILYCSVNNNVFLNVESNLLVKGATYRFFRDVCFVSLPCILSNYFQTKK